jgi:Uma2 family endonuclease
VVVGDIGDYAERHPGPNEVVLAIEVSLSSLRHDRDTKQRVYAEAGIPTYWVVDVPAGQIEVYTVPGQGRYGELRTHDQDDIVSLSLPDGSALDVPAADLLPQ